MTLRPYSADLQQQFRSILSTPGAPEAIDDGQPVVPVAIVAGAFDNIKRTATIIQATRHSSAGNTTIGTVPAGRVWRILSVSGSALFGATAAEAGGLIALNGITVIYLSVGGLVAQKTNTSNTVTWSYSACPVLTAGQTVVLTSESAGIALLQGTVTYIDESA